jgi:Lrp/AsnC family leucine-responsive transcriptional regulator
VADDSPNIKSAVTATDWRILEVLQTEGKATYAEIARRVGLSQAATHDRVKRLERLGVIKGYRAVLDAAEAGLPVKAFVFVEQAAGPRRSDLPTVFAGLPGVVSCHSIAGDESYLLIVRAADTVGLERLLNEIRDLETVVRTRTVVGLTTWFESQPIVR